MKTKDIENLILNFIGENYGSQEMDDPCYNIAEMAKYIKKGITCSITLQK